MDISRKIEELKILINDVAEQSEKEYIRTKEIYDKEEHKEEYHKSLFSGFIQHFSILSLHQLIYTLQSLRLKRVSESMSDTERGMFFQPFYFEKNSLSFFDVAWNKMVTVIKFRFTRPDKRLAGEISRVLREAKKNTEFRNHSVNKLIKEIRGSRSYQKFNALRGNSDHGYEPKYRQDMNNIFDEEDIYFLVDKTAQVVREIVEELASVEINLNETEIEYYKVRIIDPVLLQSLEEVELTVTFEKQILVVRDLINNTLNNLDILYKWMRQQGIEINIVDLLISFLSDICFRANDLLRTFGFFVFMYKRDMILFHPKTLVIVQEVGYDYFMNIACIRLLSIFDKIGLFFSRIFPMPKESTYFKNAIKWISENADDDYLVLKNICDGIVNSDIYKSIDMIRQQFVHGMDFSIKQNEGTEVSEDYILLSLYYNILSVNGLLKYIVFDFFPVETERFLFKKYQITPYQTSLIFDQIKSTKNNDLKDSY